MRAATAASRSRWSLSELHGLPMPAHAEIVLEGEIVENVTARRKGRSASSPAITRARPSEQPVVHVRARLLPQRSDPRIASPMRPPSDFSFSKCVMKAGMIWDEVERAGLVRRRRRVVHEFGGARMFNVIAIKQAYPGHARQAGLLAAGCQSASYLRPLRGGGRRGRRPDRPLRRDVGGVHALRPGRATSSSSAAPGRARSIRCSTRRARPTRAPSSTPAGRIERLKDFPIVARASPELSAGQGKIRRHARPDRLRVAEGRKSAMRALAIRHGRACPGYPLFYRTKDVDALTRVYTRAGRRPDRVPGMTAEKSRTPQS